MNQIDHGAAFCPGCHLTVIDTDLVEAETLIRQIAEKEHLARPHAFAGLKPHVYFKMPYIQPCDSFQELRRLILRVRENTGLRAEYRGIVAIEATEWLGHEREEYFTVLLKYLYDHREQWQAVIVLQDCGPDRMRRFLAACVRYMTPKQVSIRLFEDAASLLEPVRSVFRNQGSSISQAAAAMLAEALVKPELKEARSLEFIHRAAAEIISYSGGLWQITEDHVKEYLLDSATMLYMLAGKCLYGERGTRDEEALHL